MSVVPSRKLRIRKQIVEQRGELTNKLRVLNRLALSKAERDATLEEVDEARKSVRKALEIGEDKELNGVDNVKQESLPQNVEEFCSLVKTSCQEYVFPLLADFQVPLDSKSCGLSSKKKTRNTCATNATLKGGGRIESVTSCNFKLQS